MENETIVKELLEIKAKVDALLALLQSDSSITASIAEIRKIAVLEEVYRLGGSATPNEISAIATKYGKSPSSTAGYYSGNAPSLAASEDSNKQTIRKLTPQGETIVKEYRKKWGEDWLLRIPLDVVGNPHTRTTEIAF